MYRACIDALKNGAGFAATRLNPAYAQKLMGRIKQQFDPNGILNPDKMLPPV